MEISRVYVFEPAIRLRGVGLSFPDLKANILINNDDHACIADFGLLTIIPDQASFISTISFTEGGTIRWMSPELLDPESFGLKDSCPTKESDCYALGMVAYEVLSGQMPFYQWKGPVIIRKVMSGERPGRPQGTQAVWFTDDLWEILELCWKPQPRDRPSLKTLLQCLENATQSLRSLPPVPIMDDNMEIDAHDPSDPMVTDLCRLSILFKATTGHPHGITDPAVMLGGDQVPVQNIPWSTTDLTQGEGLLLLQADGPNLTGISRKDNF